MIASTIFIIPFYDVSGSKSKNLQIKKKALATYT